MTATLAQQLAAFAAGTSYDDLPDVVVESVKMRVLDTIGIAVAAAPLETSRAARRWAAEQGGSDGASAVGESAAPARSAPRPGSGGRRPEARPRTRRSR